MAAVSPPLAAVRSRWTLPDVKLSEAAVPAEEESAGSTLAKATSRQSYLSVCAQDVSIWRMSSCIPSYGREFQLRPGVTSAAC